MPSLRVDPPAPDRRPAAATLLEIGHLSKRYGAVRALHDLTFEVRSGEIFGFVGSNGAGKTTAMRIMLGVLAADSGTVRWNGAELDLDSRRRFGYMPEERGLYPKMKVGEQLRFLAGLHGMSPADAADAVERWTDRLGVGDRRNDNVESLSLGNQQRVQLAAALVHDPAVLVLDEPFSGLDPVAVDIMSDVLRERADAGVPVIFSSHQLDLVERLCDRVGIIRAGRMQALGTIDELRTTDRLQWLLEVEADPGAVLTAVHAVPGVQAHALDERPGAVLVELAAAGPGAGAAGAEQDVLRAALAVGAVRSFGPVRPTLADLFREIVSGDEAPDAVHSPDGSSGSRRTTAEAAA
ncbi:ABC transporter ATP-binding protein [Pengzhenrongella frigida]|uniref:ABC transporter ATP-binding protein n=1 Tax=Pengzhenrongella frigida TaxID=1259133 RepID=A0A4Q5N1X5_9MICO|nr:ATP-binding cassette domain-containing protein [Cellulomonas sp. HLT2-17]RYV52095.1 ABC transporter ATP-binding protein [Cellulomonas sp. HLT2-17]